MKLDTWLDKTYKLRAETAVGPKVMWGDGKKHGINEIYFPLFFIVVILFYLLTFITKRKYEPIKTIMTVYLHNMPKDWSPANLYHGLGFPCGLFTQSCSLAATQNNYIHNILIYLIVEVKILIILLKSPRVL